MYDVLQITCFKELKPIGINVRYCIKCSRNVYTKIITSKVKDKIYTRELCGECRYQLDYKEVDDSDRQSRTE